MGPDSPTEVACTARSTCLRIVYGRCSCLKSEFLQMSLVTQSQVIIEREIVLVTQSHVDIRREVIMYVPRPHSKGLGDKRVRA
jgi:hypothetical protein